MTARIVDVVFDANDPMRLARFWAEALRWDIGEANDDEVALVPNDERVSVSCSAWSRNGSRVRTGSIST